MVIKPLIARMPHDELPTAGGLGMGKLVWIVLLDASLWGVLATVGWMMLRG